jgi:hypothetical protein
MMLTSLSPRRTCKRWLGTTLAALAIAGSGCGTTDRGPFLPSVVRDADARLGFSCNPDRADVGPSMSAGELRARRADVAVLVRQYKQTPEKKFIIDDSTGATTSMSEILTEDLNTARDGPCDPLAYELSYALHPDSRRISPRVKACFRAAGATIAKHDQQLGFYYADRAHLRLGTPYPFQTGRLAGEELQSAAAPHQPPGTRWLLWLVKPFESDFELPISEVVRQGRRDWLVAYLLHPTPQRNKAVRGCLGL